MRVLRGFQLHVYGLDGSKQLEEVSVLRKLTRDTRLPHPGPISSKTQMVNGPSSSPIDIRVTSPERYNYYAMAPGYAWTRLEVNPFLGGVRTLQLQAGGSLDVKIQQLGNARGKVFRIRRQTKQGLQLYLEFKRYGSQLKVAGLPVGSYTLSSEEPIRPHNMPVFGKADVIIEAGQTIHQQVILADRAFFKPVPLAGRLVIPEAWGDVSDLTLVLTRLDPFGPLGRLYEVPGSALRAVQGAERTFAWQLDEVMPGAFDLQLAPLSLHSFHEIQGGGNLRLHIEYPQPRQIEVQLLEERTRKPASVVGTSWSCQKPLRLQSLRSKINNLAPLLCAELPLTEKGPGQLAFRAPQVPLRLLLDDPNFEPASLELDATTSAPEPWLVRRSTGVRVRLMHQGRALALSSSASLSPVAGSGRVLRTRAVGDAWQLDVSAPGSYVLTLAPVPGRPQTPPEALELRDGEVLLLDLNLED